MKSIGAAKFKEHCLSLLESLAPEGLIITKHGKPVARIIPYPPAPEDLIGSLRDKSTVRPSDPARLAAGHRNRARLDAARLHRTVAVQGPSTAVLAIMVV